MEKRPESLRCVHEIGNVWYARVKVPRVRVGHAVPGLALSLYSAGASEAQMVATATLLRYGSPIEAPRWGLAAGPSD
jgi:hypothetical protein